MLAGPELQTYADGAYIIASVKEIVSFIFGIVMNYLDKKSHVIAR
jgi:hypothetical protein